EELPEITDELQENRSRSRGRGVKLLIFTPYKCNKKWVVALNPLPHCGSGSQADGDASCDICKRRLNDPTQYRYCSVACKVEALSSDAEEEGKEVGEPGKRKHRRKGVPQRAALF
ncbi:unnamed protein product, partial [Ilex paraguariensis]